MEKNKTLPGDRLTEGAFALRQTVRTDAEKLTAAAFAEKLTAGEIREGGVYAVTGAIELTGLFDRVIDGRGATVFAPSGLSLICCTGLSLRHIALVSRKTALTVDALSADVTLDDVRLEGAVAVENRSTDLTLLRTALVYTKAGVRDEAAAGIAVRNCRFLGRGVAFATSAADASVVSVYADGEIRMTDARNALVANTVAPAITLDNACNASLVLNRTDAVTVTRSHAVYVVENETALLTLKGNDYLLADKNNAGETVTAGNTNTNGDNLMDVDARLPVGADERLLPHVDKDLFVGMTRKSYVRDPEDGEKADLSAYIARHALTDDVVVIAPGAYTFPTRLSLEKEGHHTKVYAFGVYAERPEGLGAQMRLQGVKDFAVYGMLLAFRQQSCGQVYVLEKQADNRLLVVTGAGMMNEFGDTDPRYYNTRGMGAQRMGTFYAYCDTWCRSIEKNADGTMTIVMNDNEYARIKKGDILTCRASNGGTTISLNQGCEDIVFRDFTMYGGAAGFAWVENDNYTATTYYRVLNTTRSSEVIDEATYDRYRALEKQYGVSLEVYRDAQGRFRGSPCHIGSIDATHTSRCAQGSVCISCLFENMCDDGTNQNHAHARVAAVTDNGDGTATVLYKGMLSEFAYHHGSTPWNRRPCGMCAPFAVGHRVYIYTAKGQLVADTPALTATEAQGEIDVPEYGTKTDTFTVTVRAADVNFAALEGFDMSLNTWNPENKVLLDNMSLASNGFLFDNVLVRAIRSRGLLIKASDAKILNCTFRDVGMSCGAILYEIFWGESGVTENLEVARNLFDHTGFFNNSDLYAPVSITGLGSRVDEEYLLYKNINIHHNVMRRRTTNYAVYVNSAKGIRLTDNDFGTDGPFKTAIHIKGACDVEIARNIYPNKRTPMREAIVCEHVRQIHGADVEENGRPLFPDEA